MRKFFLLLVACLLLASCASKAPKKVGNPVDLYVAGVNLMQTKKYDKAIENFKAIREQYPFDPMALVAAVKLGDTYFLKKEYVLASGIYEDYFRAYPEEENIPYVLFRLGECYEKLSPSVDRDQAYTTRGIERLTYLRNRYPESSYATDASPRLGRLIQKLADRELYIGEFYFRSAQYNAAIIRLEDMLKRYPDSKNTDKALHYLIRAHRELGNQDRSDEHLERLRSEFPKSIYARSTVRERKSLKPAVADEKVTAVANTPPQYSERTKREIDLRPQVPQVTKTPTDGSVAVQPAGTEDGQDKGFGFLDRKKPIDIVSDTMEGFDAEKYVIFKGNVIARQDDLYIYSDTMEALISPDTNEIEKANAKGNVKIIKQDRTATSREAFFDNVKGEITLKGDAVVTSGQDRVEGDVVKYYINEDRAVVDGEKNGKAKVIIYPKE